MSVGEGEGKGKKKRRQRGKEKKVARERKQRGNIMNDGSKEKKWGIRKRGLSEVGVSTPDDPFFRITPSKNALEG